MRPYFAKMPTLGRALTQGQRLEADQNEKDLKTVEAEAAAAAANRRSLAFLLHRHRRFPHCQH